MQFPLKESWSRETKMYEQHNSQVVVIPSLLIRHLGLEKGAKLEFHWIHTHQDTIVVKVIRD